MSGKRREGTERGTAAVEFALVVGLLLMVALGAFEVGMALRNWVSVTTATREGARVAASAATFDDADCVILEATAGALQSFSRSQVDEVDIFQSVPIGEFPSDSSLVNRYRPIITGEDTTGLTLYCTNWVQIAAPWDESEREPDGTKWIGVRVRFKHHWTTGFLWWSGTATWTDDAIFRIEPEQPD